MDFSLDTLSHPDSYREPKVTRDDRMGEEILRGHKKFFFIESDRCVAAR